MPRNHRHDEEADSTDETLRFGISMPARLLERFDALIAAKGYTNRSEAVRDLIRDRLIEIQSESAEGEVVGSLAIVYDHETRTLADRMTGLQHHAGHLVVSTMHVHLDHRNCLEVLALKGSGKAVRELADRILSLKGVKHGKLIITGAGESPA